MLFDASRKSEVISILYSKILDYSDGSSAGSSLYILKPGDRIFIFLLSPFFVSTMESFIALGRFVSTSFPKRPGLIQRRKGDVNLPLFLISKISSLSPETYETIKGFQRMVNFVFPHSPLKSPSFSINTDELLLLTEVALQLNPQLTISNTSMLASQHWCKQKGKRYSYNN